MEKTLLAGRLAVLLSLLPLASGSTLAARLQAESSQVKVGAEVTIRLEQARLGVPATWRSSPELELLSSEPGSAVFRALKSGRGLVSATVDGDLASTALLICEPWPEDAPAAQAAGPAGATAPGVATAAPVPAKTAVPMRDIARSTEIVSDAPWLRAQLPADTFAYARIPSVWGLLGAPKGNLFDPALTSAPYTETVLALRTGLIAAALPMLPPEGKPLVELLLARVHSPLEIAVSPAPGNPGGLPSVLLTATLDVDDPAAVNKLLSDIAAGAPPMELRTPLQAGSTGLLMVSGMPLEVMFDASSRRLALGFVDPAGQPMPLQDRLAALSAIDDHPMSALEQSIDASGQGLFVWADPGPLLQIMEGMGMAQEVAMVRAMGGSEAKGLAFGMGGSGDKQRISITLDMPQVGLRSMLPAIQTDLPLRTAGAPDTVVMLGLPGPNDLALLEANLQGMMPPEEFEKYQQGKAEFNQQVGLSVEDILGTFGPEVLLVFDKAGRYSAIRLRNADNFEKLLARLIERFKLTYETRELLGARFHHLTLPSMTQLQEASGVDMSKEDPMVQKLAQVPSHMYWIQQDGYLLMSATPQTLMDYLYHGDKVVLGQWMREQQGLDAGGALLMASTRSPGVPRIMYEVDLWLISYFSELLGNPVDLFTLPSATELGLPDSGAYSLALNSAPNRMSFELVYESSPIEAVFALGGMQTLFTTGIVAAIAIPAYDEYAKRAAETVTDAPADGAQPPEIPPEQTGGGQGAPEDRLPSQEPQQQPAAPPEGQGPRQQP